MSSQESLPINVSREREASNNPKRFFPQKLGPEDVMAIAELERKCFSHPWTEEQIRYGLTEGAIRVDGIYEAKELIAYCSYYPVGEEAEIVNIAVKNDMRQKGAGRCLLGFVLQTVAEMGIKQMFLEVRVSNTAAIRLYSSYGFNTSGVRKNYYPDTNEDALVMTRLF